MVLERQLLLQLGERLQRLRKAQALSAVLMAQRVGISRTTLAAVEAGDPGPSIGTYLRVMSELGVAGDLEDLQAGGVVLRQVEARLRGVVDRVHDLPAVDHHRVDGADAEDLVVAVVVILLFGRGKISGMMGEVASGIKAFQKGMKDDDKPVERVTASTETPVAEPEQKDV